MTGTVKLTNLDTHFADFIVRIDRNPGDELWWGAALTSNAAGSGHTCFNLAAASDLFLPPTPQVRRPPPPTDTSRWQASLRQCSSVGSPGEYTPLVLDQAGRLYLHRCWGFEQQVATAILGRNQPLPTDEAGLEAALDRYFPRQDDEDLQRSAARMALTHRFSVISGGPGTGKTATVARILALLLHMGGEAPPEITLAAPTGKAALRLHQSILHAADHLQLPDSIKNGLPAEVSTIHRLLGMQPRSGGFRHNRDNRLTCDILVVDEASMVDLQLMAGLLTALPDDARVILLGDRNQLASVEAGSVLADICDCAGQAAVQVTQLTKSYRFGADSGIAALSRLTNNGEGAAAVDLLKSGHYPDIIWRPLPAGRTFEAEFSAAAREGFARYGQAPSPAEALSALGAFRILSPLRTGLYGVETLNRACLGIFNPGRRNDPHDIPPMPVMVTGNNYELGLFNGDTGVVMKGDDAPVVWFENPEGGLRHLSTLRLPPWESAFALTVHKSQGSEFDRVLLIMPDRMSELLSRELLYTAITRARCCLEIWAPEDIFRQAVENRTVRTSGLVERLAAG
jgi:exodeoxyribonuclease V alpha subunit